MKKIIPFLLVFIICTNTLSAQPQKRKVTPKKPNNFSWGATNPDTKAKGTDVAMEEVNTTKPKANQRNSGTKGKRQHKPIQ
ncbi:MAG: hypothetical protein IPP48_09075 [Chitinophagaceae bacterium]|nr:hypothetical protein [Chitinophagaceae bacterium]